MSDLHTLPLVGHDMLDFGRPSIRARVFSATAHHWYWEYLDAVHGGAVLRHGPFTSQPEAYASARRMVEAL